MSQPTKAIAVAVVVDKVPMLKSGGDAANAKQLGKLFADAQNGMRRIVALGLFAWELKESQLKHGEFGAWLAAHCPKLATENEQGKPRPSRALQGYMELTKGVLETVGFPTVEKFLGTVKSANNALLNGGKFLLIADKKVPEDIKPLRKKIFALVDGKTQRSLFMEFKQAEDDEDGNPKKKRGQLKGSKGLTKEQREAAKLREEQERIEDLEQGMVEHGDWLDEWADDKNGGQTDEKKFAKFAEKLAHAHAYAQRVLQMRKGQS